LETVTEALLNLITAPRNVSRAELAELYRRALSQSDVDWPTVNAAIVDRWGKARLRAIKELAGLWLSVLVDENDCGEVNHDRRFPDYESFKKWLDALRAITGKRCRVVQVTDWSGTHGL
jgi:hypothetical protein